MARAITEQTEETFAGNLCPALGVLLTLGEINDP
jgi:hypothetical protein